MALAQSWELPNLIVMLIKGTDTPRANIARLAADTAKLLAADPEAAPIAALLQEVGKVVPGTSLAELAEALPLSDEIRATLLSNAESGSAD
jgi:HD-like signal output (HDOD) protein